MLKHIVKPEKPEEPKVGQKQYISFGFDLLHDTSFTECKDSKFFIGMLQRLRKLCSLGWNEINKSERHSFGYEKIPADSIKKDIHITRDVDHLLAFRATGDNHVFLGFRDGNVFKIVFIESQFGDIYKH